MSASHPVTPPPARWLVRARDLADARYADPLTVDDLAREAGLSRAHFSAEFRRAFGQPPHVYLLTRRLERAASLLVDTDRSVAEICVTVGLSSVGSFTTSFRRMYGLTPTAYRAAFPPAADRALIPACVLRAYGTPQHRTFREDMGESRDLGSTRPGPRLDEAGTEARRGWDLGSTRPGPRLDEAATWPRSHPPRSPEQEPP